MSGSVRGERIVVILVRFEKVPAKWRLRDTASRVPFEHKHVPRRELRSRDTIGLVKQGQPGSGKVDG